MARKGVFFVMTAAAIYGLIPVAGKLLFSWGGSAELLTALRCFAAMLILWALCRRLRIPLWISPRQRRDFLLVSLFGSGLGTVAYYNAIDLIDVSSATTIHYAYPVFVALFCRIFYKERLGRWRLAALVAAMAGIACFFSPDAGVGITGVLVALVAAGADGFYLTGVDKWRLNRLNPFLFSFYLTACNGVIAMLAGLVRGSIDLRLPGRFYLVVLALGVAGVFASLCQVSGIRHLGAVTASVLSMLEPIAAALGGVFLLGESMGPVKLAGCAVILVSIAVLVLAGGRPGSEPDGLLVDAGTAQNRSPGGE